MLQIQQMPAQLSASLHVALMNNASTSDACGLVLVPLANAAIQERIDVDRVRVPAIVSAQAV